MINNDGCITGSIYVTLDYKIYQNELKKDNINYYSVMLNTEI